MSYNADLRLERGQAIFAVSLASDLARRVQSTLKNDQAIAKDDSSPVTVADFAVQALVVQLLSTEFPRDKFVAEETSKPLRNDPAVLRNVASEVNITLSAHGYATLEPNEVLANVDRCDYDGKGAGRTWVLDPIDGTRGFIALRQYCVALALVQDGVVQMGTLGCPNLSEASMLENRTSPLGCIFHATRGEGAWMVLEQSVKRAASLAAMQARKIHVSDVADPIWSVFCESVEVQHSSHEISARVAAILGVSLPPVRMDSQAKYGCIARGDASIFLRFPRDDYTENIWDHAAGAIIIEEAGGRVTDGRGRPLNFALGRKLDNDDGIVASNKLVHDAVVSAIQKAKAADKMNNL